MGLTKSKVLVTAVGETVRAVTRLASEVATAVEMTVGVAFKMAVEAPEVVARACLQWAQDAMMSVMDAYFLESVVTVFKKEVRASASSMALMAAAIWAAKFAAAVALTRLFSFLEQLHD